ncbi:receptor like protein 22-like [Hibiscus syriacus]|uniref:receptor like protein 22-like n=1 Tax=Hibiscus syriacus TaxID=106335 RepID=UPI001922A4E1|nr:receptor like protein 22-like [Hibiscus syriacus]
MIVGSLPRNTSLFRLQGLKQLNLSLNNFNHSSIPYGFSQLVSLTHLDLSDSFFSVFIPLDISLASKLISIDLSGNHLTFDSHSFGMLTGHLPESNWSSPLRLLDLSHNHFSGSIPASLGNLTTIASLDFSSNEFGGPIPDVFGNLIKLTALDFYDCKFTALYLSNNSLTGPINQIQKPKSIQRVYLAKNDIHGEIPTSFIGLIKLTHLDLSSNNFSAAVEFDVLSKMKSLTELDLSNNKLLSCSSIDSGNNSTFRVLENLVTLDLGFNLLQGSLPAPPPSLQEFLISKNKLSGEIPPSICNLTSLDILDLSSNYLGGIIPACLGNFSQGISTINLQMNNFRSRFPDFCLSVLPDLQVLILRSNRFHGGLHNSKATSGFLSLQVIDLSQNKFTGPLPTTFFPSLRAMQVVDSRQTIKCGRATPDVMCIADCEGCGAVRYKAVMKLNMKRLEMELDLEKSLSSDFTHFDFLNNQFNGRIPEVLAELCSLLVLNLSHNSLTGPLPSLLGSIAALESLDLTSNKLGGRIPSELTKLTFLEVLNLSQNNFVGPTVKEMWE